MQLPFSRGSIVSPIQNQRPTRTNGLMSCMWHPQHISSTNYTVQPTINPNYFIEDFGMHHLRFTYDTLFEVLTDHPLHLVIDLEVLTESVKFARKLATTGGFANVLGAEADPGADVQTDDQIKGKDQFLHCRPQPRGLVASGVYL